jgi:hypothetical protein
MAIYLWLVTLILSLQKWVSMQGYPKRLAAVQALQILPQQ